MALFTDGTISTIEDLQAYDAAILRVASAEGVDLSSKLRLAETEVGIEIEEFLTKRGALAATGVGGGTSGLANVVVTPPLKQWNTLHALALTYADIDGNHLNSRYATKLVDYRRRARWAADSLFRMGVGMVAAPVVKAKGLAVRTVAGDQPIQPYYLQIAWSDAHGASGMPSDVVVFVPAEPGLPAVRSLTPPEGVSGFDVYAGTVDGQLRRQNATPIACDQEWVMPATGLLDGDPPGSGQAPEWFVRNDRVLLRG